MSPLKLLDLVILLHTITTLSSVSTTEFVYNTNFNSTNIILYGNATTQTSILTLTNNSFFSIGRAFYPQKIPMKPANSSTFLPFATSFIFSVAPIKNFMSGHGFAFIFTPSRGVNGTTSNEYLGLFNFSNEGNPQNHVVGVEFDTIRNIEFNDMNDNHVGVDINSLTSLTSHEAGYWGGKDDKEFKVLKIKNGENYQVWIEFINSQLNITMARAGQKRPRVPLISRNVNLSGILMDETYVGFCAATGRIIDSTRILAWSFSNSNFSIGDALMTDNLPSFVLHKGWFSGARALVVGVTSAVSVLIIACGYVVFYILCRGNKAEEEIEDWELEYWPHRISFPEIDAATRGFSEENVVAVGGNGKVYKGVLQGIEVAVKRIPQEREEGMREFLAEISSLGRMKHRNLVGLRGWCKKEKGNLILVYDFMNNGSLDKRIFECEERKMLTWEERIEVLKNVAAGILYLHEGWEVKVLHRDIKASNVLLDKDMNARLGDFGLARMHDHHGQVASTTRVIGTVGYIAPEVIRTGTTSTLSDVFGFGILVLEVICGRRPIEEHKPGLIEWVMSLMVLGQLHSAVDARLKAKGEYTIEEAERLLHLGLLCSNSDPSIRPTMRQVVKMLQGEMEGVESDEEIMEMSLLGKIKSAAMWSKSECSFPYKGHPTFDEIRMFSVNSTTSRSESGTIPGSESDIIREGR
ncbi:probable L-type lectin-domain containing receptor kinase VII.2 [Gastrolobium bilobum]|uniref:probable L-type lectin-domain containing receptor kinase VII.2 n=1 Tax=Gastrolobium bilobum TaxID=150636 RepID=UPI002AAFC870|nr:probable L-type lectin-domain containing receptor kinase VII.2 [Gastrolobium bilobum]